MPWVLLGAIDGHVRSSVSASIRYHLFRWANSRVGLSPCPLLWPVHTMVELLRGHLGLAAYHHDGI